MTRLLKQTKTYLKDSKRTVLSDKHFTSFQSGSKKLITTGLEKRVQVMKLLER